MPKQSQRDRFTPYYWCRTKRVLLCFWTARPFGRRDSLENLPVKASHSCETRRLSLPRRQVQELQEKLLDAQRRPKDKDPAPDLRVALQLPRRRFAAAAAGAPPPPRRTATTSTEMSGRPRLQASNRGLGPTDQRPSGSPKLSKLRVSSRASSSWSRRQSCGVKTSRDSSSAFG